MATCCLLLSCNNGGNNTNSDETADLKFNLIPGAKYRYVKTSHEVLEPEMNHPSFSINQDRTIEATYVVADPQNGPKKLNFTLDHIMISVGNDANTLNYDSNDSTKQVNDIFHNVGNLLHRNYSAGIADSHVGSIDKSAADSVVTDSSANQMTSFSNASISALLNDFFNIFPPRAAHVGDSWQTKSRTTIGFVNVDAQTTYKLNSINKGVANISINANLASAPTDSADVDMRGVQMGDMAVDIATGMIVNCNLKSHINGSIKLGINAPASISSEVNIRGTKL